MMTQAGEQTSRVVSCPNLRNGCCKGHGRHAPKSRPSASQPASQPASQGMEVEVRRAGLHNYVFQVCTLQVPALGPRRHAQAIRPSNPIPRYCCCKGHGRDTPTRKRPPETTATPWSACFRCQLGGHDDTPRRAGFQNEHVACLHAASAGMGGPDEIRPRAGLQNLGTFLPESQAWLLQETQVSIVDAKASLQAGQSCP